MANVHHAREPASSRNCTLGHRAIGPWASHPISQPFSVHTAMRSKMNRKQLSWCCAQDDLSPELQAITRIIGALQAMQNMRLPAALGGSKPEEAEARTSRGKAGAGSAQSRGRGSSEAEDAEAHESSGKECAGGSRGRGVGGSMAGDMDDGRDSKTRGSKAGDGAAGQSSSREGDGAASKAEAVETGQSGGKGADGGEAREERAGGEEAAESARVDEKSPESYEPCMPGRVLYIERCVGARPLTMFVQSPREM